MAVEDRAKELNSLAEKIRGSFTRFNSQLKSISDKRKRISRNVAERKERRAKLKASASSFGRSVGSITSNVLKTPGDIFGKVISFASLFLLGALVNMIPQREQQVDKDLEKTKEKSTKVGNFFVGMVDAVKGFFGGFDKTNATADKTIAGIDDSSEEANKEFSDLEKSFENLDNSDKVTSTGGSEDKIKDDDNTDDVDNKFKKPNAKGFGALKRDSKIKKNYEKVSKEFIDTESALVRDKDLVKSTTVGEVVPFNKKQVLNKIEETLGRGELQFATGVQDGKEVVIISQKVLVD
jgi:chromosome segregation ATPase